MTAGRGWLVCAPGDPTEQQLDKVLSLAHASGDQPYCMTAWNADTGDIEASVGHATYVIAPSGKVLS